MKLKSGYVKSFEYAKIIYGQFSLFKVVPTGIQNHAFQFLVKKSRIKNGMSIFALFLPK